MSPTTGEVTGLRCRQTGAVLVLALLVMGMTLTLGLAFLTTSTAYLEGQSNGLDRVRARALAESAVALGYRALATSPSFRGVRGPIDVGAEQISYEILDRGGSIYVRGFGTSGVITQGIVSKATAETSTSLEHVWGVGGDLSFDSSSVRFGGTAVYGGSASSALSIVLGDRSAESLPIVAFDATSAQRDADFQFDGALEVSQISYEGNIFVNGSLIVRGDVEVRGSLFVTGSVEFDGGSTSSLVVTTPGTTPALVVVGDLYFHDFPKIDILGHVFVGGNVALENSAFGGNGSLYANGDLSFTSSIGTWTFNNRVKSLQSDWVSGMASSDTEFTEVWRRPDTGDDSVGSAVDSGSGSSTRVATGDGGASAASASAASGGPLGGLFNTVDDAADALLTGNGTGASSSKESK